MDETAPCGPEKEESLTLERRKELNTHAGEIAEKIAAIVKSHRERNLLRRMIDNLIGEWD